MAFGLRCFAFEVAPRWLYELNHHQLRCGPCKAFAPTLDRFAAENPDLVRVMKFDIDEFTGIAGEIGIRSVPTLLVVKDGQVVAARSGAPSGAALATFFSNAVACTCWRPNAAPKVVCFAAYRRIAG